MNEYYKAIERLKQWDREHENAGYILSDRDKFIFPELAESEDERIRKHIIEILERLSPCHWDGNEKSECIAYLEKQKEQKSEEWNLEQLKMFDDILTAIELDNCLSDGRRKELIRLLNVCRTNTQPKQKWSEEDERMLHRAITIIERNSICNQNMIDWLKSLRPQPKQEWREEDEKMLSRVIEIVDKFGTIPVSDGKVQKRFTKECLWLKSLRPQPHWRPSEEQPENMIQWTGNNLKEVIDFTGKSPRFEEWFKSWVEFEQYVHSHNDIVKLFCEDGSHYEVPVGAWIVKTPDGYNVPSRFVQKPAEWSEEDERIIKLIESATWDGEKLNQGEAGIIHNWLKSLRPTWKPSEEQKSALDYAYCELFKRKDVGHNILGPLSQLCDDLKKLM